MEKLIFDERTNLKKKKRKKGAYKSWGYKKSKLNFTLDKTNGMYLKRIAELQGISTSMALNKLLFMIRTEDQNEIVHILKEKKMELEYWKHIAKNRAILIQSEEDILNDE